MSAIYGDKSFKKIAFSPEIHNLSQNRLFTIASSISGLIRIVKAETGFLIPILDMTLYM